jgi:glycosyltransferase involved in cell wall biosynthesis
MVRAMGSKILVCPNPSGIAAYGWRFLHLLREHGPYDVVHSHLWLFNAVPLALAAAARVPIRIAHIYPLADIKPQTAARSLYQHTAAAVITHVATSVVSDSASSLAAFNRLRGGGANRGRVIFCGIDVEHFAAHEDKMQIRARLGLPQDVAIVTYVARFVRSKNHELIFQVADHVNADKLTCHFVLAGSHGELMTEIANRARSRADFSVLVGLPDVAPLLSASDIFLFPSLEEGFGLVAIEAAAAGVPVIATDLPTIREATPPSFHDLMFPPNDWRAAAKNLETLLFDETLRRKLGAEGPGWSQRFSIERSVADLVALYEQKKAVR